MPLRRKKEKENIFVRFLESDKAKSRRDCFNWTSMEKIIATVYGTEQEKKEDKERAWFDLLPELLGLILSHLFAGDYCAFRSICRSWRSVSTVPRPLLLPNDAPLFQSPCLMFLHKKNHLFNFFHPMYNATYQADIPELLDAEICFSNYGWLLMCKGDHTLFFFNPATEVKIVLPDIPRKSGQFAMCFSSPPTSSNCLVVGIGSSYHHTFTATLKRGEMFWTMDLFSSYSEFHMSNCNPVMCNGLYYCLGGGGNLAIFNPMDYEWTLLLEPKRQRRLMKSKGSFLIESDGDLFAVFVDCDGRPVYVLRLDFSEMAWHEIQSLGDKMFYICRRTSFSEKAVVRGTGNKIYFPKFYGSSGLFYSLATQKYHSFVGDYCSEDSYNTKDMMHCTWIKLMHPTTNCYNKGINW